MIIDEFKEMKELLDSTDLDIEYFENKLLKNNSERLANQYEILKIKREVFYNLYIKKLRSEKLKKIL